jgi:hypothetical protein
MKAQELETKSAGYYAYAAARDASMRAVAMWSHYTDRQRVRAERMKLGLEQVYSGMVYVNPGASSLLSKWTKPGCVIVKCLHCTVGARLCIRRYYKSSNRARHYI